MSRPNSACLTRVARFSHPGITPRSCGYAGGLLALRPPQIRKPLPRRPALNFPITQADVFDDRLGDHVALGVSERTQFLPNLPAKREARTSLRNSSATVGPHSAMCPLENGPGTKSSVPYREPNRRLSVWRKVGGITILPTAGRVADMAARQKITMCRVRRGLQ
jgi:hypothetical protein